MSIWDIPGEVLDKGYEAIPGTSGLPGFGDNPGLLTKQKSGNLLVSKAPALRRKAHLNQKQVAELWIFEGGDSAKADEWSAIIMGESGGNAHAHENGDPKSCCHGLAQLNVSVGNATMKCAMNAGCATKKSIALSNNGTDFTPWGAFTDGAYKKYLGKSGIHGSETHTTLGDAANSVTGGGGIGDLLKFVARLFEPSFWLRVGKAVAGFLLLLFGALTLMKVLLNIEIPLSGPTNLLRSQVAAAAGK